MKRPLLLACISVIGLACDDSPLPDGSSVQLPGGEAGIGLDDLRFSSTLDRIVVAGGRTGAVSLIDPDTLDVVSIEGFTASTDFDGSDQQGVESADEGGGLVFAVDREAFTLDVIDPSSEAIIETVELEPTEPDYVRYSAMTSEVWITNPGKGRLQVLAVPASGPPEHVAFIPVPGGVEGIVIDGTRMRAYTHSSGGISVIDLESKAVVATWPTGCDGHHGIPVIDEQRGLLFAGCRSAEVVVLDLDDDGNELDRHQLDDGGATLLAYSPSLHHFYLRGDGEPSLAILGVSDAGKLSLLGTLETVSKGHCHTPDDRGNIWVCDWDTGSLWRFADPFDPSP